MKKIYTRRGDDGFTGLLGEQRVPKYHLIPEAVGMLDEASAALGAARAVVQVSQTAQTLLAVQRDLYNMMAEVAATPENAAQFRVINAERVEWLEMHTDAVSEKVDFPNEFIVPGGTIAGGMLALARTIVRRAERKVVQLAHDGHLDNPEILRYLNRLSSLCFTLELLEEQGSGKSSPTLAKD
jgi:cob(I)alamin adenosyltransferase